ncbi:class I SAM-dependent methyltransferase [Imhoffiella purpurea]|uniref:Methyltransferase domain-containing protein n=1 Tax=Imhoffiella purpurea TaxID=1249627 RepID=W9VBJ3_9GAMM|nr:class I SAM-dependent methyltransferase [Imhoffiella purpurea]EXJ13407.1 hypothetical protein D779_3803 [Imhoffiella purpurea]
MRINDPTAYRRCGELEAIEELVDVAGREVLELGCGAARMTRALATRFGAAHVTATEVDRIQLDKNLAIADLPGVTFRYGGAESIEDPDGTYDLVFMFKSLHHVPGQLMPRALAEIHRVLAPGGRLYVSEPVYWGEFNDLMRLINDEREVRQAAFSALRDAVDSGLFQVEREVFYEDEGVYADWEGFAARFIQVTHTALDFDEKRIAAIRAAFERHLTPDGARFLKPHRVDLLRRID